MSKTFGQLGLPQEIVDVLAKHDIVEPFPIQTASIPDAMSGRDVAGKAPTGSGKTLAFGLPMLTRVATAAPHRPRGLILAPTRELAAQIRLELAPYAKAMNRQVFAIFGGVRYPPQRDRLRKGVDILVATPGRLEDLIEQGAVNLSDVNLIAVDEADRMADMGFLPDVRRILDQTSDDRQTLLFSATLDGDVGVLIKRYQTNPARHEVAGDETKVTDAEHHFWLVDHSDKVRHTADAVDRTGSTIVFARTRHGADRLARQLSKLGVETVAMHGGRSQNQRNKALASFSAGRVQALIATDVAARGIHVDDVASVIHFDPPQGHKDYLHRSGRTARAGATGTVLSLVTHGERRAVRRMQGNLDLEIPIEHPRTENLAEGEGSSRSSQRPAPREDDRPRTKAKTEPQRAEQVRATKKPKHKKPATPGGAMQSIYIGNLPWKTTGDDLRAMFQKFGTVNNAVVKMDRRGRSKGVGFVEMPRSAASSAVHSINGSNVSGRPLKVRFATDDRRATSGQTKKSRR
jgi:superfamily II DNA/RNA helicase